METFVSKQNPTEMGRHMNIMHEMLHHPPHNEEVGALRISGKQRSCPFTSTDPNSEHISC